MKKLLIVTLLMCFFICSANSEMWTEQEIALLKQCVKNNDEFACNNLYFTLEQKRKFYKRALKEQRHNKRKSTKKIKKALIATKTKQNLLRKV